MIKKSSTFISGVLAFGIYFTLIILLLFYFNSRDEKKSVHFVKKNEDRIRVSMSAPTQKKEPKKEVKKAEKPKPAAKPKPKSEPKPEPKKVVKPKPEPKPKKAVKEKVVEKKPVEKKVIKEKVVKKVIPPKKTEDVNRTKPKIVNKPKDLFANVSSKKVEKPKVTPKATPPSTEPKKTAQEKASATALLFDSLKQQKSSDKGIENAYLALIEEKLRGWPAQSDYAGEKAKVWIKVEPSGSFVFKVITASGNDTFNEGLEAYLTQLQRIGFGRHKADRAYELNVEFIAKE